jgi:hypothetical protein
MILALGEINKNYIVKGLKSILQPGSRIGECVYHQFLSNKFAFKKQMNVALCQLKKDKKDIE